MRVRLCYFPAALRLLMLTAAACLLAGEPLAARPPLLDRPLRIVTEAWHPYVFEDAEGKPAGSDLEITEAVFAKLGQPIEVRFCPWKRCIELVRTGNADALLGAIRTPEREAFMMYPENPLSAYATGVFVRSNSDPGYTELADLVGDKGGTLHGYQYCNAVRNGNLSVEPERSLEGNFRKLERGRIDYIISNLVVGESAIRSAGLEDKIKLVPNLNICADAANFLPFARKEALQPLFRAFDAALAVFRKTEDYRRIEKSYQLDGLIQIQ